MHKSTVTARLLPATHLSHITVHKIEQAWAAMLRQFATCVQEHQRQGILGIHMDSLDEHLDQQQLQKLLGEVIHKSRASLDGHVPDHQVLASVVLSRYIVFPPAKS